MDAGIVEQVIPPGSPGEPVELLLRIDERLHHLVRADALARILSEGMVGVRVVELTPGEPDSPIVTEGGAILTEPPLELSDLMKQTGGSLHELDKLVQTAHTGLEELGTIARSIREGQGSLGKFVRDDDAYQSLMSLSRRGEKTVAAMEDNLSALEPNLALFPLLRRPFVLRARESPVPAGRPAESRSFPADDLFEPKRAILTPLGRTRLDEAARWCKQTSRPTSEIVIAAFTDDDRDLDLAEVLTQEQAQTVRKYLVEKHGIDSAGWFRSRKVAAVGFGTQVPRGQDPPIAQLPPRRIDIILFTPQT